MDNGGNVQSNDERTMEKSMDAFLRSLGLHRKKIAKDGSCLFRAVAEQVLQCQSRHTEVRAKCVEFLKQNRDSYEAFIEGDFEEYLFKLQDPQQWVGEVEINALAVMYKRDFEIFQEPGKPAVNITDNNFKDKVRLCFLNGNHYDSVYPAGHIKSAALCQSILYELLYENVFKVDRSSLALCNRSSRPNDLLSDDIMPVCSSSDESDQDAEDLLWVKNGAGASSRPTNQSHRGRGRGRQLPERVRRSLNPTLLRNVEYDIWHKSKRAQQKMDYSIAAGMQFTVGDRCQVRLDNSGRSYNATLREAPPNSNKVTVYVEEQGLKQVPLWSLRPPSNENSWSTVVHRDKRLSNGHGEWEEKGRGRGRGKSTPATPPSSVSSATAAGSSGRVQKQHSWPPQATVAEQGGAKSSRKSTGSTESSFGLTEEERLAKEEEERNVALVEIQLRDEHSFPALGTQAGTQAEGGRRKGGDKRRSQGNKTKSPVEDVGVSSPSAGERPKSSSPPPAAPSATNPTSPVNSAPPAAKPADSESAGRSSFNSSSTSTLPPSPAAPTPKTNIHSYASATAVPSSPPANVKPSIQSSAALVYVTPALPSASSPPLPPTSAATPPSSSSAPQPTFIAPIAPSPTAAQGFLRSVSPITSLPHSHSPPPSSSSSSVTLPPPQEAELTPASSVFQKTDGTPLAPQTSHIEALAQINPKAAPNLDQVSALEEQTQSGLPEIQTQSQASLPVNPVLLPQSSEAPPPVPQHQPQPHSQVSSEPRPDPVQVQSSQQIPAETSCIQSQNEALSAPPEKPESHPPPPHPASLPQLHPLPHHPHPGVIPLHQLYQDPLYPGFPQGEKGEVAQIPPFSTSKTGDDLPKDLNILKFFFNLGVKAYSMPITYPYLYLLPLQQIYTMQPKPLSHSPSPLYLSPSPPTRYQEDQPPTQYPPPSVSPQYDHQTQPAEPLCPTEPSFNQASYQGVAQPPPQRIPCPSIPWQQQMPPPRNPSYPVGFPSPPLSYSGPPPSSQGYHPGQGPVHSLYPSAGPQYSSFSQGFQSSSAAEELQASQAAMEQLQPPNGDSMPGQGHVRVLGPLESPAAANVPTVKISRTIGVPPNFAFDRKFSPSALKESGDTVRTVLLVDPPLNNKPILAVVSDPDMKDASVTKATMKAGSIHGSPSAYRGHRKPLNPNKTYVPLGAPDPSQMGYPTVVSMAEPLSVACSTEDDFEVEGYTMNYTGNRKYYRGRRGRGGHDAGRGAQRRRQGDVGAGPNYVQFSSSYRGRGRERGY